MKDRLNVEAEGGELILRNSHGDLAIIPAKYKLEVQDMVKGGCFRCIDNLVQTLPTVDSYKEDGYAEDGLVLAGDPINPSAFTVSALEERSRNLTRDNAHLNFVQRANNPDGYPYLTDESSGERMTHKMSYAEQDGRYVMFPTVVQKGEYLHDFGDDWRAALDYARDSGELIETEEKELAEYYTSRGLLNKYKFGGKLKANNGMSIPNPGDPPTRQDSINLLNNTKQLEEYYKHYRRTLSGSVPESWIKDASDSRDKFKRIEQYGIRTHRGDPDRGVKMNDYYRKIDDNRFYQREFESSILDIRAPRSLYDKRITPTYNEFLINDNPNSKLRGDLVNIFRYDPLQVTPWDMLTPSQQKERVKRFGYSGTPLKPTPPTRPTPPTPPTTTILPENIDTPEIDIDTPEIDIDTPEIDIDTPVNIPTLAKPNLPVVDHHRYTAWKQLARDGKPVGYVNLGKGKGRREIYANELMNDPEVKMWMDSLNKKSL